MKFLKFTYKMKSKHHTRMFLTERLIAFDYDHRSKYLEIEIHGSKESGFVKNFNLNELEIFLNSEDRGIFSFELVDNEDEII